ncbi:unnamed protein product [Urochloa humidicola]
MASSLAGEKLLLLLVVVATLIMEHGADEGGTNSLMTLPGCPDKYGNVSVPILSASRMVASGNPLVSHAKMTKQCISSLVRGLRSWNLICSKARFASRSE